jgi:hypothetical protein
MNVDPSKCAVCRRPAEVCVHHYRILADNYDRLGAELDALLELPRDI